LIYPGNHQNPIRYGYIIAGILRFIADHAAFSVFRGLEINLSCDRIQNDAADLLIEFVRIGNIRHIVQPPKIKIQRNAYATKQNGA
jgi:hypothetical protein